MCTSYHKKAIRQQQVDMGLEFLSASIFRMRLKSLNDGLNRQLEWEG